MRKRILLAGAMILILPAVFLTASCAKKEMQTDPVSMSKPEIRQAADTSAAEAEQAKRIEEEQLREERLREEAATRDAAEKALVNENIHFAFNSETLTGQAQRLLNSKAGFLRKHSNISVTVEGHCDDRGSESYNMALGKRRAESV
jgi:peptidoglycan-associated lipoprotein